MKARYLVVFLESKPVVLGEEEESAQAFIALHRAEEPVQIIIAPDAFQQPAATWDS